MAKITPLHGIFANPRAAAAAAAENEDIEGILIITKDKEGEFTLTRVNISRHEQSYLSIWLAAETIS